MNGCSVTARTISAGVPGAPLVVFAHGLEGHWSSWTALTAHLDPTWRMVSLDLPWRAGNDYRWRERLPADWLGDGLDLLGERPDALVGHSFGANAALDLACALDERIGRSIALMCPFYRMPRNPVTWRMYERSRAIFAGHIAAGVRLRLGDRAAALDKDVLDGVIQIALDRAGPMSFAAAFDRFVASADLRLGNVSVPTRVLVGARDPISVVKAATELTAAMPCATIRVYERGDHFFHVPHARDAAAEVAGLVAGVRTATTRVGDPR